VGERDGDVAVRRWDAGTEACSGDAGGRRRCELGCSMPSGLKDESNDWMTQMYQVG
jgi:hypothetical protein